MKNYFVYLPSQATPSLWGCTTTAAGFTRIPPGSPYPLLLHPEDHQFEWERGRILQSWQMVFISEGRGTLEVGPLRRVFPITPGCLFLLFPGVWHRYAPDPAVGWVEHWIECGGSAFAAAQSRGLISPGRSVIPAGSGTELADCFQRCHAWAQEDAIHHQDLLSTLGLHLLSVIAWLTVGSEDDRDSVGRMVQQGQALIMDRYDKALNVEAIAAELHVGYSHFRQAFKARTGISPKQFHQQTRMKQAYDLLVNTDKPVKEIADLLGFSSLFHFSRQFKELTGVAPTVWRQRTARK